MQRIKDHKTPYLIDPFHHLGPKRKRLLDSSWAGVFRRYIRPILPVHLLAQHFSHDTGRPTNELVAMMGAMILQQMHDLTDEETQEQFAFNIQWHYALDITTESDKDAYVCLKSLWNMRHIMTENGLYEEVFKAVSDHLSKVFEVDTRLQRIDSVHIFSNMRHLGRIGIFTATIQKFLRNLKRHHPDLFETLDKSLRDKYLSKGKEAVFSMVKPSESARTLREVAGDLFTVVEGFRVYPEVRSMTSYQLMVRVLKEQCTIKEDKNTLKVEIKSNKEVPSDSLQNPSDPDAGYDGHKGKGYQAQIAETYTKAEGDDTLRIITHVKVQPAHESDAKAVEPYLEDVQERQMKPLEVLADSLYGSDGNCELAKEKGVDLVSPCMGAPPRGERTLSDFEFHEDGRIAHCPMGHEPIKTKHKKNRFTALFDARSCEGCPYEGGCPAKKGERGYYVRYDKKSMRLAQRRAAEGTEEFRDRYRFRAGIEGSISELDRKTGVKKLRVRGKKAVRFCVFLKATGLNVFRVAAYRRKKWKRKESLATGVMGSRLVMVGSLIDVLVWRRMWARLKGRFGFESQDVVLAA